MFALKLTRRPWLLWPYALAVAVPAVLVLAGRQGGDSAPPVPEVRVPADWTTADLLRRLEPLGLRAVPANRSAPPWQLVLPGLRPAPAGPADVWEDGAFLTTTGLGWDELSALHKAAVPGEGALECWRGTVFVRAYRSPPDTRPLGGGKRCALQAGRFYFYGDPELLDRVEALLGEQ
jgi:hypothetical protein